MRTGNRLPAGAPRLGWGWVVAVLLLPALTASAVRAQNGNHGASPLVLRTYHCDPAQVEAVAIRLQAEYAGRGEVRIAADPVRSQILVYAPAEHQTAIAERIQLLQISRNTEPSRNGPFPPDTAVERARGGLPLGAPGGRDQFAAERWRQDGNPAEGRAAPLAAHPAEHVRPDGVVTWTEPLRHAAPGRLQQDLVQLLAGRLAPLGGANAQVARFRLAMPGAETLDLAIDYRRSQVELAGSRRAVDASRRLIQALDAPPQARGQATRLMPVRADQAAIHRLAGLMQASRSEASGNGRMPMVAMLFQQPDEMEPDQNGPNGIPPGPMQPGEAPPGAAPAEAAPGEVGEATLVGPVQVEMIEGLDVLVIRGLDRDVQRVIEIIEQIERLSAVTEPVIEVYPLRHVDSAALTELLAPLYAEIFLPRQGAVSITALVKPNSLLLIGRRDGVERVIELVGKLDRPVAPNTQFRVFRLRHAAAETVQATVAQFFVDRGGLGPRVLAVADFRSNSLIVQAGPRDIVEVAAMVARLDTSHGEAVNEMRIFQLEHSLAEELAPLLQAALSGQPAPGQVAADQRSVMLRFLTVDELGRRRLDSGILTDVRVTADPRANSILVSAPAESMDLIAALIRELDRLPAAEAQIKVFTVVNADAAALVEMLQALFAQPAPGVLQAPLQAALVEGESTLVPLRFAVDQRSNSIIASGSRGDLQVVEAILLRLDATDVRQRRNTVYRLRNSPAADVAAAINTFLTSERQVLLIAPGLLSPVEQIEREVVVVAEPISNSLIVSATPRFFEEIRKIVEELDERPPMVMIQVMIAEVTLNDTEELGFELGLQDSILFNRSLLGDIVTTTRTTFNELGQPTSQNQEITSATFTPGFAFNNQPLGQSSGAGQSRLIGTQGLSHFGVGRLNTELGFGGFVFSASSESVSVLIRALKDCRRLEVLSRPQVMTLDNQPAFIQVGQRVPRITSTQVTQTGIVNSVTLDNVGLILGVTPRISPDGLVVMEIDAEKSEVGPEAEGIPVSILATGQVIRSPRINTATAQTTVSALTGQTVVLGGLITKSQSDVNRKVPWLGDMPVLGFLFRYDAKVVRRTELLIIMTPHIVRTEEDVERIKRIEASRMHWCLSDVVEFVPDPALRTRSGDWSDSETPVVYPDLDPTGRFGAEAWRNGGPEIAPAREGAPAFPPPPGLQPIPAPQGPPAPTPAAPPSAPQNDSARAVPWSATPGGVVPAAYHHPAAPQAHPAGAAAWGME
jgi:general secretion pathway protein D